jgi:hypothetical protein
VKIRLTDSERFLRELSRGLEVLGPAESREVVIEVGTHLADAVAEAEGVTHVETHGNSSFVEAQTLIEDLVPL